MRLRNAPSSNIAVDLDGTLIFTDTLHELVIALIRHRPLIVFLFPIWIFRGKAHFKAQVCDYVRINPKSLPYNHLLINWLLDQKKLGKKIFLCTAAHQTIANDVAHYLGFFDGIMASDDLVNNASTIKRQVLENQFGFKGFDYAGNSKADYEPWKASQSVIAVNTTSKVLTVARGIDQNLIEFPQNHPSLRTWIRCIRLHQWLKNLLIFIPLLAAHKVTDINLVSTTFIAFLSFCFAASATYIANDLLDLENDRNHPRKRNRPLAAGKIAITSSLGIFFTLLLLSIASALLINIQFFLVLAIYLILTTAYSLRLKQLVLLDCLILSLLYSLRIIAGAIAIDVPLSFWLIAFSIFIFLSLAFVKRFAELKSHVHLKSSTISGRGYRSDDATAIQSFGVAAGYVSVLVLAFYLHSDSIQSLYQHPELIWASVPLVLFWISWIWLKAHREEMHDDPIVFAIKDKVSVSIAILLVIIFVIAAVNF